jgi:hypothetical protein
MATQNTRFMQSYYSGAPAEKLAAARTLFAGLADQLRALPQLQEELGRLRLLTHMLNEQMRAMEMGQRCGRCAARPGGGCCSALMADNTDSLQLLINLLLDVSVTRQPNSGENCCFLGAQGCVFLVKPIFCLNYHCTHIVDSADPEHLDILYQRVAAVLSRQTRIETLLLDALRTGMNKMTHHHIQA